MLAHRATPQKKDITFFQKPQSATVHLWSQERMSQSGLVPSLGFWFLRVMEDDIGFFSELYRDALRENYRIYEEFLFLWGLPKAYPRRMKYTLTINKNHHDQLMVSISFDVHPDFFHEEVFCDFDFYKGWWNNWDEILPWLQNYSCLTSKTVVLWPTEGVVFGSNFQTTSSESCYGHQVKSFS